MKILICNGAYIGDVILSTSVLPVLKKLYPKSTIGFLCASWSQCVVKDHIYVDKVHHVDLSSLNRADLRKKDKVLQQKITWKRALKEIKEIGYDCAIDLYSYYQQCAGKFLYQTQIPIRVAHSKCFFPYYYNKFTVFPAWFQTPMVDNHKKMLHALGVDQKDLENFRPFLKYHHEKTTLSLPEKYILLHMGTGEKKREWDIDKWKKLVVKLGSFNRPLVFIGKGKRENERIEEVMKHATQGINLCNLLAWHDVLNVVKKAELVIGLESMIGHVTAHYNVAGVFIYGIPSTLLRWKPYSASCTVVTPPRVEQYNYKYINKIADITPESVFKAVQNKLFTQYTNEWHQLIDLNQGQPLFQEH